MASMWVLAITSRMVPVNNVASWLGQMKSCVILCLLLAGFGGAPALATTYISLDEFVTTSFAEAPAEGMLWLKGP